MDYIFIHGLGQTGSDWNKTCSYMNETITPLCPDLLSLPNRKNADYSSLYSAFEDYCSHIPGAFHLCGLSLGAILALNYSMDHPDRIRSLTLIGAQYRMPKALLGFQNFIFRLLPCRTFSAAGFSKEDFIRLTASMAQLDFSRHIGDIACPALIICGERDSANKKAAVQLAAAIPNAKLRIVEKAGHEVNKDAPEELAGILSDFYLKQTVRSRQ